MNSLKSNYNDIDKALRQLELNGLATNEMVFEGRMNNIIIVRAKRYRSTLRGVIFIDNMLDGLVVTVSPQSLISNRL